MTSFNPDNPKALIFTIVTLVNITHSTVSTHHLAGTEDVTKSGK